MRVVGSKSACIMFPWLLSVIPFIITSRSKVPLFNWCVGSAGLDSVTLYTIRTLSDRSLCSRTHNQVSSLWQCFFLNYYFYIMFYKHSVFCHNLAVIEEYMFFFFFLSSGSLLCIILCKDILKFPFFWNLFVRAKCVSCLQEKFKLISQMNLSALMAHPGML